MTRLRSLRSRLILITAIMGPGIVTALADNDAGGITTYTVDGATYGYEMLWVLFLVTFSLAVVQEMCARMGAVTGKGLSDLIRENFGPRWTAFAMVVLLVANSVTAIADFAGIAAAVEIFGIPRFIGVPFMATAIWFLVVKGSYHQAERAFIFFGLFQIAYVVSGIALQPEWGEVLHHTVIPTFHLEAPFILLFIATIGTTITPWMQFYLQSSVVDKGLTAQEYHITRWDILIGAFITDFVSFFIIITATLTLHRAGITVQTPTDAAMALAPVAGQFAQYLFAIGLFGSATHAVAVISVSTAYAVCEAFGLERGINRSFQEAPAFFGLYTAILVVSAVVVLFPDLSLVTVMLLSQDINGILLPIVLVFMLLLVNNRRLMGRYVNGPVYNILAWGTAVSLITLTTLLLVTSLFPGLLG